MENQFDFYHVDIMSSGKRPLLAAGIKPENIHQERTGYKVYGSKRFPVYVYRVTVDYMEPTAAGSAQADIVAAAWTAKGFNVAVRYHCSD